MDTLTEALSDQLQDELLTYGEDATVGNISIKILRGVVLCNISFDYEKLVAVMWWIEVPHNSIGYLCSDCNYRGCSKVLGFNKGQGKSTISL